MQRTSRGDMRQINGYEAQSQRKATETKLIQECEANVYTADRREGGREQRGKAREPAVQREEGRQTY